MQDLSFHKSDHHLLCSVGSDKRAQILSLNDHQTAALIETDTPLTSCDWSFDGSTLAIGTANGKISLYDTRKPSAPMKVSLFFFFEKKRLRTKSCIQNLCSFDKSELQSDRG